MTSPLAEARRLRGLLDAMEDAFCVIELVIEESGAIVDLRYKDANRAFYAHTGVADVNGRLASDVFPQLEPHWFDNFAMVHQTGVPTQFVERAKSLNRWYEVSLSRIGDKDQRQLACLFKDISERKLAEDERETTARKLQSLATALAESDQRKTEFLATLAHELRNPLAPIRSGLELIQECRQDPDEVVRSCKMASRQVDHMVRLVDDLLDISRISQGMLALKLEMSELDLMVKSAIDSSRGWFDSKDHELRLSMPDDNPSLVVDAVRISQVIANLLSNAAKYTPDGGIVELSVSLDEAQLSVSVTDTGDGLARESLGQIFDMFTQITGDAPRENTGLGIGLTLSKRLVELHGGKLQGFSEGLGKGSRFEFFIPATLKRSAVKTTPPSNNQTLQRRIERILVVDDNEDAARSLARLLERRGYSAGIAVTGQSALESILQAPPHVVFLDIGLPDLSGIDVATTLGNLGLTKGLSLVALTGWGSEEDKARCENAGFSHHMTKPVSTASIEQMLAVLEQEAVD